MLSFLFFAGAVGKMAMAAIVLSTLLIGTASYFLLSLFGQPAVFI
jgi:hypothetical protein